MSPQSIVQQRFSDLVRAHRGEVLKKVAWLGALTKGLGSMAAIGAGYHGVNAGLNSGARWTNDRYIRDNGLDGPYIPGHTPQVPSQMSFEERQQTPMSGAARAGAEGIDAAHKAMDIDASTFLASNPSAFKFVAPLVAGMEVARGGSVSEAARGVATDIAPASATGSLIQTYLPSWKPPGLGGTVLSGIGAGAALKGTELAHDAVGMSAPTDLIGRANESPWNKQYRGFNNLLAGTTGGFALSRNPVGAVMGGIAGAAQEPMRMADDLSAMDAIGDRLAATNQEAGLGRLADPRVPMDRVGDLNLIPADTRDKLLELRHQRAASGEWDAKPTPRSTWKDMNQPEGEMIAAGKRPSELAAAEINNPKLKVTPKLEEMRTKINLHPHLAVGGGVLAAGLGLYGLRKLFGRKEDEDKPARAGYASPRFSTPDRWVTA